MKSKRKFGLHSLYVYLTMSFVFILIVALLSTALYFEIIRKNKAEEYGGSVKEIINEKITEDTEVVKTLKHAIFYGMAIGLAILIIVTRHIIKPIRKITEATKEVASGNLKTEVDIKRNDEIGKLADNFNLMVKELNSIEYLRKDFISNVSHELKTPIASMQGFAKLLKDENISKEEKEEYIEIILEETTRLSNLSSNIMKLSKFENQKIIINKSNYRLDEQIRKAIIMLETEIDEKNLEIELKSQPITINEDKDLIMEIWINLLNNAIKYTNKNGKITININENNEFVNVIIKDNGIGIPKDKQQRIFEKFYQAEKSHSNQGNGLGLSIVKRIIELIDGKITFSSEEGKGTTFNVYIRK